MFQLVFLKFEDFRNTMLKMPTGFVDLLWEKIIDIGVAFRLKHRGVGLMA